MPMLDVAVGYPIVKLVHLSLVLTSGALFALRGALVLAGRSWVMARPWRWLSYGIDTLLLAAGVTLWAWLSLNPVSSPWLGTKFALLAMYIGLGSLALKRARTRSARQASYLGALTVYGLMISVALAHHPLGVLHRWAPGVVG